MSEHRSCPHCELAAEPATEPALGGPNGITESAILRGIGIMARLDKERTPEQHAQYVRAVVQGIREHLVQRHLYDQLVAELRPSRAATASPA